MYVRLTSNKLTLNIDKSNFVIFRPSQKKLTFKPVISIFDNNRNKKVPLDCKGYVKYLGVLIDQNISGKHAKRRNTRFSMDLLSFHRCHAISTIFRLNKKSESRDIDYKNSFVIKSDFITEGIPHSTLKMFHTVTYHLITRKIRL